ncbi:hypothetical protein ACFYVL_34050 [Streptomyces sp. NPDC004111]|uniref:hypothetical protein n=1 Tax=Streptomyces sp. NPDC004111 TaxID=3364690 RepID=UPI0036AC5010
MTKRPILGIVAAAGLAAGALAPGANAAQLPPPAQDAQHAAAVAPTISPAAPYKHTTSSTGAYCRTGNLCLHVWDPTKKLWKTFFLYKCRTYSLAHWKKKGTYHNHQTGGRATAEFYDHHGQTLKSVPVSTGGHFNWTPVWKVRNCT